MATATLDVRIMPRRLYSLKEAAHYCNIPMKKFEGVCPVSRVAMPAGIELYDVRDLDRWIDEVKNGASDSDDAVIGKL